eukprot:TRINITY_DN2680_c0_g1_i4.p1 TRINITY_DN2680_c0_g1~~TRINITY_DN2680_c0_g1_i4.p1  ORF type:complete len:246 (-),score=18.02 TRINITY_DN2680_c0_g1_i4:78-815(-)
MQIGPACTCRFRTVLRRLVCVLCPLGIARCGASFAALAIFAADGAGCSGKALASFMLPSSGAVLETRTIIEDVTQMRYLPNSAGALIPHVKSGGMTVVCNEVELSILWCATDDPRCEGGWHGTDWKPQSFSIESRHVTDFLAGECISQRSAHGGDFYIQLAGSQGREMTLIQKCASRRLEEDVNDFSPGQTFGTVVCCMAIFLFVVLISVITFIDRRYFPQPEKTCTTTSRLHPPPRRASARRPV